MRSGYPANTNPTQPTRALVYAPGTPPTPPAGRPVQPGLRRFWVLGEGRTRRKTRSPQGWPGRFSFPTFKTREMLGPGFSALLPNPPSPPWKKPEVTLFEKGGGKPKVSIGIQRTAVRSPAGPEGREGAAPHPRTLEARCLSQLCGQDLCLQPKRSLAGSWFSLVPSIEVFGMELAPREP